jgi:hypothetical protein
MMRRICWASCRWPIRHIKSHTLPGQTKPLTAPQSRLVGTRDSKIAADPLLVPIPTYRTNEKSAYENAFLHPQDDLLSENTKYQQPTTGPIGNERYR